LSAPPDPLAAIGGGVPTSKGGRGGMGKGKEGDGKGKERGREERGGLGGKGRGGREGESKILPCPLCPSLCPHTAPSRKKLAPPMASGVRYGEGCPLPSRLGGLGERREAAIAFSADFRPQKLRIA